MQEIWIADNYLQEEINSKVKVWFNEIKDLRIPRRLQNRGIVKSLCLNTFVDASENAYKAVVNMMIRIYLYLSIAADKTKV